MKTTGELKAELAKCFMLAKNGDMKPDSIRGVIGTANQINLSFSVEMRIMAQLKQAGEDATALGNMKL